MATISGGSRLNALLDRIAGQIEDAGVLRVGFLETETYPDGTPVAQVAFWSEFGAVADVPAHQVTVYRSIRNDGTFNRNGRFVQRDHSNYATTHTVPAHQVVIPARPFFRHMIADKKPGWSLAFGNFMQTSNYNVDRAFQLMGELVKDQLTESIVNFADPPNAPSTVRKKGFNNPLINKGQMQRSTGYEIEK